MADYQLYQGDCLEILPTLAAESVDSVICDPPYGLGFMGRDWDHGVPGEHFWREALRVAKPGAHLLAFGGTRTFHRLAVAIEDAGWEIRDTIMWVYGSGFPKSLDVSKMIDKAAGAVREVVGQNAYAARRPRKEYEHQQKWGSTLGGADTANITAPATAAATAAAAQWDGWGTALKPAWEPIIVARKPLIGTVAENVLQYGTGGINIDGCRVEAEVRPALEYTGRTGNVFGAGLEGSRAIGTTTLGRWPANVIHDGSDEVLAGFPQAGGGFGVRGSDAGNVMYGGGKGLNRPSTGQVVGYGDTGSASRFFYTAKASKADRDEGCEGMENKPSYMVENGSKTASTNGVRHDRTTMQRNNHPTVKPTELMRYLCKLVTPPGGIVLDPFMGSGSTGRAAVLEGFNFIGIDLHAEYVAIAQARIEQAAQMADGEFMDKRGNPSDFDELPLFAGFACFCSY